MFRRWWLFCWMQWIFTWWRTLAADSSSDFVGGRLLARMEFPKPSVSRRPMYDSQEAIRSSTPNVFPRQIVVCSGRVWLPVLLCGMFWDCFCFYSMGKLGILIDRCFFSLTTLLGLKFRWLVVAGLGACLSGYNLYAYMKAAKGRFRVISYHAISILYWNGIWNGIWNYLIR